MIRITEEKLRAAIQICLGGDGIYTEQRETKLVHDIKALSTPDEGRREELKAFGHWLINEAYCLENDMDDLVDEFVGL